MTALVDGITANVLLNRDTFDHFGRHGQAELATRRATPTR